MGTDQPDFEALQQMLALKRHEMPPPGFFQRFPDRVRAAIAADRAERSRPWWERLWRDASWRPALVGACALGLVVLAVWKTASGTPPQKLARPSGLARDVATVTPSPNSLLQPAQWPASDFAAKPESVAPNLTTWGGAPAALLFRSSLEERSGVNPFFREESAGVQAASLTNDNLRLRAYSKGTNGAWSPP
jgi:hypothetical protein